MLLLTHPLCVIQKYEVVSENEIRDARADLEATIRPKAEEILAEIRKQLKAMAQEEEELQAKVIKERIHGWRMRMIDVCVCVQVDQQAEQVVQMRQQQQQQQQQVWMDENIIGCIY